MNILWFKRDLRGRPDDRLTSGGHIDRVDVQGLESVFDKSYKHQGFFRLKLLVLNEGGIWERRVNTSETNETSNLII